MSESANKATKTANLAKLTKTKETQEQNTATGENISTSYDDAFRTMLNDCVKLVIPVINEIFGKNYTNEVVS